MIRRRVAHDAHESGALIQVNAPAGTHRQNPAVTIANEIPVDAALLARYDVQGPRYTSYPPAPRFGSDFDAGAFAAVARSSNDDPIPRRLSLYVHAPFCLSPCFYCGCSRIITRDRAKAESYLVRLHREIELVAPLFDRDRKAVQLHFGGGTPNFFDVGQMADLIECLDRHFGFAPRSVFEAGIEIDPRSADRAYIEAMGRLGFNRISVGVQDFDPAVQAAVNRIQSVEETRVVIEAARESGFRSASIDLIYGLPKQSAPTFRETLDRVLELAPDRVVAYGYAHLPSRFRAQRQIRSEDLPSAPERIALLELTVRTLTEAGYRYIGMDHFARADDDLASAQRHGTLQRNFQGYSTHAACDLVGVGMSSISHVGHAYSQNARDLTGYYAALDAGRLPVARGLAMSEDDIVRADAIQHIMCHGTIDVGPFEARHGLEFDNYFARELDRLVELAADGLVEMAPERVAVTPRGRYFLRNIAMVFDAYLPDAASGQDGCSRTV
ncbi:MAG TPA: oxygen-independent coproporphyrinogen III oxidase [Rhodanobacteraceae bacterium]|nr:oxygen-independent coproporphyrinogen III oxidase [Rhodanobacteraceae bacterium]